MIHINHTAFGYMLNKQCAINNANNPDCLTRRSIPLYIIEEAVNFIDLIGDDGEYAHAIDTYILKNRIVNLWTLAMSLELQKNIDKVPFSAVKSTIREDESEYGKYTVPQLLVKVIHEASDDMGYIFSPLMLAMHKLDMSFKELFIMYIANAALDKLKDKYGNDYVSMWGNKPDTYHVQILVEESLNYCIIETNLTSDLEYFTSMVDELIESGYKYFNKYLF